MNKMELEMITDEAGSLRLQVPGHPGRHRVHVTVEWDSVPPPASAWPQGWLEATSGSIKDPTFVRHPQGDYEDREPLG